jgi:hypothetical protein
LSFDPASMMCSWNSPVTPSRKREEPTVDGHHHDRPLLSTGPAGQGQPQRQLCGDKTH